MKKVQKIVHDQFLSQSCSLIIVLFVVFLLYVTFS